MGALIIGFFLSLAFSLGIGNQNAFLVQKSLLKNHPYAIALTIISSDFLFKLIGLFLLSRLYLFNDQVAIFVTAIASLLLLSYGWNAFIKAIHIKAFSLIKTYTISDLKNNITTVLKLKLSNPKVYFDSFIIIAALGLYFDTMQKYEFLIGTLIASTTWYLTVVLKPQALLNKLEKNKTWKIIEIIIAISVWIAAFYLIKAFIDVMYVH